MPPLHRQKPKRRTNSRRVAHYRDFKSDLREDFNKRCGYCDGRDLYFGNQQGFHIDHFAPKSIFPKLKNDYYNLVYSCPICNWAKSNKWFTNSHTKPHNGKEGFVDPCSPEFDDHLNRTPEGEIKSTTPVGECMVENLNLNLMRHQILWIIEELEIVAYELYELKHQHGDLGSLDKEICDWLLEINRITKQYTDRLNQ